MINKRFSYFSSRETRGGRDFIARNYRAARKRAILYKRNPATSFARVQRNFIIERMARRRAATAKRIGTKCSREFPRSRITGGIELILKVRAVMGFPFVSNRRYAAERERPFLPTGWPRFAPAISPAEIGTSSIFFLSPAIACPSLFLPRVFIPSRSTVIRFARAGMPLESGIREKRRKMGRRGRVKRIRTRSTELLFHSRNFDAVETLPVTARRYDGGGDKRQR